MKKIKADWLQSELVLEVVAALGADHIRFVGGAVRDTLLALPVDDIDAATLHKPEQTIALLKEAGIRVVPTGLKHGTVTAVKGKAHIEITTLRVDVETDGRHAEVAFTESWLEDAKRRDFTFNALYLSPDGALFDPFGGTEDLEAGRVNFIGDAAERIKEDALRILRFFRFYAHFGKCELDAKALEACTELAPMLTSLSVERIRTELAKLLKAENPLVALQVMIDTRIFAALELDNIELASLETYLMNEQKLHAAPDTLARLYFLLNGRLSGKGIAKWLKLSTKNKIFLCALEEALQQPLPASDTLRCRYIYEYGNEVSTIAAIRGGDKAFWEAANGWAKPVFPVQGRDLMAHGMLAGPAVGETLKKLEAEWLDSDFSLSKQALLDRL